MTSYHYISIRMTKIKKKILTILSASQDAEQLELSYTVVGNTKWSGAIFSFEFPSFTQQILLSAHCRQSIIFVDE